jgi:hypothetical protein
MERNTAPPTAYFFLLPCSFGMTNVYYSCQSQGIMRISWAGEETEKIINPVASFKPPKRSGHPEGQYVPKKGRIIWLKGYKVRQYGN